MSSTTSDSEIERRILKIQQETHERFRSEHSRFKTAGTREESHSGAYGDMRATFSKRRSTGGIARSARATTQQSATTMSVPSPPKSEASAFQARKRKSMSPSNAVRQRNVSPPVQNHRQSPLRSGINEPATTKAATDPVTPSSPYSPPDNDFPDLSSFSAKQQHTEFANSRAHTPGHTSNVSNDDSFLSVDQELAATTETPPKQSSSQKADIALLNQIIDACYKVTQPPRKPSDTFKTYLLLHLKQNDALRAYLSVQNAQDPSSITTQQKQFRRIHAYVKLIIHLYSSKDMTLILDALSSAAGIILRKKRAGAASPYDSTPSRSPAQSDNSWQSTEPITQRSTRALPPRKGTFPKSPSNMYGAPSPVAQMQNKVQQPALGRSFLSSAALRGQELEFNEDSYLEDIVPLPRRSPTRSKSDADVDAIVQNRYRSVSPQRDAKTEKTPPKEQPSTTQAAPQDNLSLEESYSETLEKEYLQQSPIAVRSTFLETQTIPNHKTSSDDARDLMSAFAELSREFLGQIAELRSELRKSRSEPAQSKYPSTDSTIDIPSMLSSSLLSQKLEEELNLRDTPACASRRIAPHERLWSSASHKLAYLHKNLSFQYLLRICNLRPMNVQDLHLEYFGANEQHILAFQCTLNKLTTNVRQREISMHDAQPTSRMDDAQHNLIEQLCLLEQQLQIVDGLLPHARSKLSAGLIAPAFSTVTRKEKSRLLQVVFESWSESLPLSAHLHRQGRFVLLGVGLVFL